MSRRIRAEQTRRTLRWITICWMMGNIWFTAISGTPTINFAKALGATEFDLGLLTFVQYVPWVLALPASLMIDATGLRRRLFLWGLYFQRYLWIPISILPAMMVHLYGQAGVRPALSLYIGLMLLMYAGPCLGSTAWTSWMADLVPDKFRGRYFSRRAQWALLTGIPSAVIVSLLLDFNRDADQLLTIDLCSGIFLFSSIFGILDITFFRLKVPDVPKPPKDRKTVLAGWKEPFKNHQFLWSCGFVATNMFAMSFMGFFLTNFILEKMSNGAAGGANLLTQMMLIVVPGLAQLLVLSMWGKVADLMGKRPVLKLAGWLLVPVGFGWCFVTREAAWLGYLLAAAGAVLWSGIATGNLNLVLELSSTQADGTPKPPEASTSNYIAMNNAILNAGAALGGLFAGFLGKSLAGWHQTILGREIGFYEVLFAVGALLRLMAVLIFMPHIHEPKSKRTREAIRWITANAYNNVFGLLTMPWRLAGMRRKGEE